MLSISIVIYKLDSDLLKRLMASLSTAVQKLDSSDLPVEVSIIDNGAQEEKILTCIEDYNSDWLAPKIISSEKNIGYGRAHNIAILGSSKKYHLVLNPDVILEENCLLEGLTYLEQNSNVGAVAPNIVDKQGKQQYSIKRYPSVVDLVLRGINSKRINKIFSKRLERYEMRKEILNTRVVEADLVSGCFMLCRRELLTKTNGFDDRYFLYFEDFSLSIEIGRLSKLHYLPTMKIQHFGGDAAKKGVKHISFFISSGIKFFNQYGWKIY